MNLLSSKTLTALELLSEVVALNGQALALTAESTLPEMNGAPAEASATAVPAASVSFFAVPGANNQACR